MSRPIKAIEQQLHLMLNADHINQDGVCKLLIHAGEGTNINAANDDGQSLLDIIISKDLSDVAKLVLSNPKRFSPAIDLHQIDAKFATASGPMKQLYKEKREADFKERIILVSAFQSNSIINALVTIHGANLGPIMPYFSNASQAVANLETFITRDGTIGGHLDFENSLYSDNFVDRPHSHWYWNSLVHANSGGNWEDSQIAILEPLSKVGSVFNTAPYDTEVMGQHKLSDQSTIIVPKDQAANMRQRLNANGGSFQGTIITFNPDRENLRQAISRIMHRQYPDAATLRDSTGTDISKQESPVGHDTEEGKVQPLSAEIGRHRYSLSGPDRMPAMQDFVQGRYEGLHSGSLTDIENQTIFESLKKASTNPSQILNFSPGLISVGDIASKKQGELFLKAAYNIYNTAERIGYRADTGVQKYAEYLIKKALIAEFRGLHKTKSPDAAELTYAQLKTMVDSSFDGILTSLKENKPLAELRQIIERSHQSVIAPAQAPAATQRAADFLLHGTPGAAGAVSAAIQAGQQASGPSESTAVQAAVAPVAPSPAIRVRAD